MTTTVVISSARPNHNRVKVVQGYMKEGHFVPQAYALPIVLDDGENTVVYVHDGAAFLVQEESR